MAYDWTGQMQIVPEQLEMPDLWLSPQVLQSPIRGIQLPGSIAQPSFMNSTMNWLSNGENLAALVQGLNALSNAWLGRQNLKIARDQLNFQKDAFNKNFANQVRSYNTSLEDRIRGRTADYAGKEADIQAYLDKHRL